MMPGMLMEVRKLLSDPEVEFDKVAKFISTHQALSAKIMSLANSVYMDPHRPPLGGLHRIRPPRSEAPDSAEVINRQ